ncbi:MAG: endonuclease III domain-containing protein [Candidatus Ranarchaeia archaeon]
MPTRLSPSNMVIQQAPSLKWAYEELLRRYGERPWPKKQDPFVTLIQTILSQHTNDKNRDRAFLQLQKSFQISPKNLSIASIKDIENAIRTAGLWRIKAKRIREVAQTVLKDLNGDLASVIKEDLLSARTKLLNLPGIGFKTADILLLFNGHKPVIPLDTHCLRVTHRLGYGNGRDYEHTRKSLEQIFPRDPWLLYQLHMCFITHGRQICRARTPKCGECPISDRCPSKKIFSITKSLRTK